MYVRERTYYKATQFKKYGDHPCIEKIPDSDDFFGVLGLENILVECGDWILEKDGEVVRVVPNCQFHNLYEIDSD